mmetsp:Transcript_17337/g.28199  ORF Transcript_17337/g.28199 Transcript_17337/m.28199 type:complete len:657 (+) Transcript_17337:114-2084(+)
MIQVRLLDVLRLKLVKLESNKEYRKRRRKLSIEKLMIAACLCQTIAFPAARKGGDDSAKNAANPASASNGNSQDNAREEAEGRLRQRPQPLIVSGEGSKVKKKEKKENAVSSIRIVMKNNPKTTGDNAGRTVAGVGPAKGGEGSSKMLTASKRNDEQHAGEESRSSGQPQSIGRESDSSVHTDRMGLRSESEYSSDFGESPSLELLAERGGAFQLEQQHRFQWRVRAQTMPSPSLRFNRSFVGYQSFGKLDDASSTSSPHPNITTCRDCCYGFLGRSWRTCKLMCALVPESEILLWALFISSVYANAFALCFYQGEDGGNTWVDYTCIFVALVFGIELAWKANAEQLHHDQQQQQRWRRVDHQEQRQQTQKHQRSQAEETSFYYIQNLTEYMKKQPIDSAIAFTAIPVEMLLFGRWLAIGRALRVVRILTTSKKLTRLVRSILGTLQTVLWLLVLLFVIFYIFVVIGIQTFSYRALGKLPYNKIESFDGFWPAVLSLFQITTTNNWNDVMFTVLPDTRLAYSMFFVSFYFIVCMVVLNVVTALIIQGFSKNQEYVEEESWKIRTRDGLFKIIRVEPWAYQTVESAQSALRDEELLKVTKGLVYDSKYASDDGLNDGNDEHAKEDAEKLEKMKVKRSNTQSIFPSIAIAVHAPGNNT